MMRSMEMTEMTTSGTPHGSHPPPAEHVLGHEDGHEGSSLPHARRSQHTSLPYTRRSQDTPHGSHPPPAPGECQMSQWKTELLLQVGPCVVIFVPLKPFPSRFRPVTRLELSFTTQHGDDGNNRVRHPPRIAPASCQSRFGHEHGHEESGQAQKLGLFKGGRPQK